MQKRGQAATEFLTTYGWAILILIIVIVLITSLGIFNPKTKNSCIGSEPIDCSDVKLSSSTNLITPNKITLVLTASGVSSTLTDTYVEKIILSNPISNDCGTLAINLQNNVQTSASCDSWTQNIDLKENNKFSGTATIKYKLPGSTSSYTSKVIFSGTVEE